MEREPEANERAVADHLLTIIPLDRCPHCGRFPHAYHGALQFGYWCDASARHPETGEPLGCGLSASAATDDQTARRNWNARVAAWKATEPTLQPPK